MKRGKIEQSVLVSILLAIIIGGVILVTIVFPVSSAGGGLSDGLCHFNMALRTALPTTTKPIAGTSLCREIEIGTINADKYSKCPKVRALVWNLLLPPPAKLMPKELLLKRQIMFV